MEPKQRARMSEIELMEARARVRASEQRTELFAIVVVAASIVATLICGKVFGLPELYGVTALLTFYLGTKTGKPSAKRVEASLIKMAPAEVASIYNRVTGRPPREPVVSLEGVEEDEQH
jgi:hypothetical protein